MLGRMHINGASSQRLNRLTTGFAAAAQLKCWRDKNSSEPPPDLAPPPPPMRSATPPNDAGPTAPSDPAAPQPLSQRCASERLLCCIPCGSCTVGTDMCTQMAACCTTKNMEVSAWPASSGCCCHGAPVINVRLHAGLQEQQQHTGAGRQHARGQGRGGNSLRRSRRFWQPAKVLWWILFQPEPRRRVCAARCQLWSSQGGQCLHQAQCCRRQHRWYWGSE